MKFKNMELSLWNTKKLEKKILYEKVTTLERFAYLIYIIMLTGLLLWAGSYAPTLKQYHATSTYWARGCWFIIGLVLCYNVNIKLGILKYLDRMFLFFASNYFKIILLGVVVILFVVGGSVLLLPSNQTGAGVYQNSHFASEVNELIYICIYYPIVIWMLRRNCKNTMND